MHVYNVEYKDEMCRIVVSYYDIGETNKKTHHELSNNKFSMQNIRMQPKKFVLIVWSFNQYWYV